MRRLLLALALVSLAGLAQAKPIADAGAPVLKPTPTQGEAAVWSARFLTRFHYKPLPLDKAMSEKIFENYLESLDGEKLFFTQADINTFGASRDKLDEAIYNKDLSAPFAIYNIYLQRVGQRVAYARSLLAKGFDFSSDESYRYDRAKAPWPKDDAEIEDQWRQRIKNDWLRLKLTGKSDKDIRETLDKRYANYLDRVHQINSEDVFQTFMNAYATAIEPHTNYLGPRASENFDIAMKLSVEGIGAVLQRDNEYTAIREIVPGGPASLSGKIQVGDRILGVGQGANSALQDVIGWRLDDVVDKIRGPRDTVVRLEVLPADAGPDGKSYMIELVRKKVTTEAQAAKKSIIEVKDGEATRRIGVISLPTFYQDFEARRRGDRDYKSATRDVERLLGELKQERVDGVVVDLRNNGGGSLSEATDLTGLFIERGPVVQVRNAAGRVDVENSTSRTMAWDGPLAVVVNRVSASASEIFAAAIQDYGRGVIIGEPTFGKGTVQNLVDLDDVAQSESASLGELKMTIAQFFRINGGSTQLRGVSPDISFPMTVGAEDFGESSYDNALPWTSIPAARYQPLADLSPIVPQLIARHEARTAQSRDWKNFRDDLADARKLREEKMVSLNEAVRRKERDEQEAKRKARQAESEQIADAAAATDAEGQPVPAVLQDDGLQADERSIRDDVKREQARKDKPDFILIEAAHILADEITLVRADTKLASRVLPYSAAFRVN